MSNSNDGFFLEIDRICLKTVTKEFINKIQIVKIFVQQEQVHEFANRFSANVPHENFFWVFSLIL